MRCRLSMEAWFETGGGRVTTFAYESFSAKDRVDAEKKAKQLAKNFRRREDRVRKIFGYKKQARVDYQLQIKRPYVFWNWADVERNSV
ncbi:MAG: hypothetical protein AAB897_01215 [Patescibacteria group bacterium]